MTNVFRKCVNRQIEIMTVGKRKKFQMRQNIIDSVLSQLLAIEAIKTSLELHLKIIEKGGCCLAHIETISSL
jgi:hypothetical protein